MKITGSVADADARLGRRGHADPFVRRPPYRALLVTRTLMQPDLARLRSPNNSLTRDICSVRTRRQRTTLSAVLGELLAEIDRGSRCLSRRSGQAR